MGHMITKKKRCSKCEGTFPATEEFFYHGKNYRDSFRPQCRKCMDTAHYEYMLGMTDQEYEDMLAAQKHMCQGCGKYCNKDERRFSKKPGPDGVEHLYCNGCTWHRRNRFK